MIMMDEGTFARELNRQWKEGYDAGVRNTRKDVKILLGGLVDKLKFIGIDLTPPE